MTYGCGNQHVGRVAMGADAEAISNARGVAGICAGTRRYLRDEGCHEYRVDYPSADTVLLREIVDYRGDA
jgi:hypothetical protein